MNYMEQIANMLGVELNEKFDVVDQTGKIYDKNMKLTENGLLHGESIQSLPFLLVSILTGNMEIKKRPWKPKLGQAYYFIDNDDGCVRYRIWSDDIEGFALYKLGKIYRTGKEAKAHKEEDAAFWQEIRKELEE